jgi:hypothetical protein
MFLIEVLRSCGTTSASRVLDIGASRLTSLLGSELGARVETMGLERANAKGLAHHRFDLNALQERGQRRPDIGPYGVIVFAEVLEHLYTAPEIVLPCLRELLVPGGGRRGGRDPTKRAGMTPANLFTRTSRRWQECRVKLTCLTDAGPAVVMHP